MVKAEVGEGRGVKVIAAGSALEMVGDVLSIVQAIHGDMSRLFYGELTRMCDRERFPIEMWRLVAAALDKLEGVCEDGRQSE